MIAKLVSSYRGKSYADPGDSLLVVMVFLRSKEGSVHLEVWLVFRGCNVCSLGAFEVL